MEAMAFVILVLGLVGAHRLRRHPRDAKQIRLRQIIHEEETQAMECEVPIPEFNDLELSDSLSLPSRPGPRSGSDLAASTNWVRLVTLGLRLTLLLGGIGAVIGLSGTTGPEVSGTWPLGLVPASVGVGLLLFLPWLGFTVSGTLQAALLLVLVTAVAPVWELFRVLRAGFIDTFAGTFEAAGSVGRR